MKKFSNWGWSYLDTKHPLMNFYFVVNNFTPSIITIRCKYLWPRLENKSLGREHDLMRVKITHIFNKFSIRFLLIENGQSNASLLQAR